MNLRPLAIYVHFPYCKSRCPYCDFFRNILPKDFDEDAWVRKCMEDIAYFYDICGERIVKSVFFGGGTPSLLSADSMQIVLDELSRKFCIREDAEISLEANPNTFERDKFIDFSKVGVNRLSLGVQALSDDGLKFLGRTHSVYDALKAMELGVSVFPKFSVDLMYARPQQNWDNWKAEVDRALSFGVKHISLYQLAIEEGTIFYKKNIKPLDDERSASLYEQTINYLRERGLDRYEVSNFAVSSEHESIHNLVYWQGGDYIGIGEGAHGRFIDDGVIKVSVDGRVTEILSSEQRAEELVIMGLRIRDGINRKAFFDACGLNLFDFLPKNTTKRLAELNFLCYDDDNIKLTDKGFLVLDKIILELLS